MKIVYMGTPDFAAHCLQVLIDEKHDIIGVFTKTDVARGRGMKTTFSPVKEVAVANDIPVFQPENLRDGEAFDVIKQLDPDMIVVVAYGKLLPTEILQFPKFGCVNVHGSLLPKYRGAAPIQWAVLNGEKVTGITTMYMSQGMDEGDMLLKDELEILPNETSGELFDRLKILSGSTLLKTISGLENGEIVPVPQNHDEATFAPMLCKDMGNLDFSENSDNILCKIYGLNPWPGAYSCVDGKKFKFFEANRILDYTNDYECGIIYDTSDGLCVACGENSAVRITSIQAVGKKRMEVSDYLKGNKIEPFSRFVKE